MPCHEISETFDFARRLHHAYTRGPSGDLRQSARDGEDKIGASWQSTKLRKMRGDACPGRFNAALVLK
jgi:hypothetical protein